MKKPFFFSSVFILLLNACSRQSDGTPQELSASRDSCSVFEKRAIRSDSVLLHAQALNDEQQTSCIKAFLDMAYFCQQHKKSPEYLIKGVQLALQENNYALAKKALDLAEEKYTWSQEYPMILFMLGELYADTEQLNDPEKAEKYFTRLEKEYPNSTWAKMVPDARKWIGKSKSSISSGQ